MYYILCYKLIRVFGNVICNGLQKATHRFLVFWRHAAIALHHHFFILAQPSNWSGGSDARDDIKDVEPHGAQGLQIASIRAALISFVAPLSVPGYAANLSHFFLFKPQSNPFFAQTFARTQLRDLTR